MKVVLSALAAIAVLMSVAMVPAKASVAGFGNIDATINSIVERRKPRIKGGSGCDSPRDKIEHPACR